MKQPVRNQLNKHKPRYRRIPEGRPGHGSDRNKQLSTKGKANVGVIRLVG